MLAFCAHDQTDTVYFLKGSKEAGPYGNLNLWLFWGNTVWQAPIIRKLCVCQWTSNKNRTWDSWSMSTCEEVLALFWKRDHPGGPWSTPPKRSLLQSLQKHCSATHSLLSKFSRWTGIMQPVKAEWQWGLGSGHVLMERTRNPFL